MTFGLERPTRRYPATLLATSPGSESPKRSAKPSFFDYVVRHELATIPFTTSALAAERHALDTVLTLLEPVPGVTTSG